eukprot:TRINITY_DN4100_c0_g1_i1.p1 TRINITY_DN4100_c0_g1~~TRINITY_DN4100_c0_g1_i1.p1  ORF type:complete len:242 (-),score=54.51 TRINITY_DN4100_c0_g1_i1:93-818(-)
MSSRSVISSSIFLFVCFFVLSLSRASEGFNNPSNNTAPYGYCFNTTQYQILLEAPEPYHIGTATAAIPFDLFWNFFLQASLFPTWNPLFISMQTTDFELCGPFDATYAALPNITFPPGTTPHVIVQMGLSDDGQFGAFAWQFQVFDDYGSLLTIGLHTYLVQNVSETNSVVVSSFEKVAGPLVEEYPFEWAVALEHSMLDGAIGVACLERVYIKTGDLDPSDVAAICQPSSFSFSSSSSAL